MAVKVTGIDDIITDLSNLSDEWEAISGKALYEGAAVLADALKDEINALPTRNASVFVREGDPKVRGATKEQKRGLQQSMGIAKKRTNGTTVNVSIGFDGYNDTKTDKWPSGQPNSMIARSLESGTSFLQKTPFISKAMRKSQTKVVSKMEQAVAQELEKRK